MSMKLQLWTTDNSGDPDELLGEVAVSDEEWTYSTSAGGDALELLQGLADEVGAE